MKFKRIFVIVCDSMGAGYEPDAALFGDEGANTLLHISDKCNGLNIPNLNKLGINDLVPIKIRIKLTIHNLMSCYAEKSQTEKTP